MCESCMTEATYHGEIFPGWHLRRAVKEYEGWKAGEWALIEMNGPSYIWPVAPYPEPPDPPDDATAQVDQEWLNKFDDWVDASYQIQSLNGMKSIYLLTQAAITKGYNPKEDGAFEPWLFDYTGKYIQEHLEPVTEHIKPEPETPSHA